MRFDYNKLYQKHFRNLPTLIFWASFVIFFGGAITGAVFIFLCDLVFVGILTILAGIPVAMGLAWIAAWFFAILLSQKIVATDSLIEMRSGTFSGSKTIVEDNDELPDI